MPVRHLVRSSALLLLCVLPHLVSAQSTTSLLPDATVLPSHGVRFRLLTAWTRYDELLGNGPVRNIGSTLATDSLTSARVPLFVPIEANIRSLSGLPNFQLTAGQVTAPANSRIVTAPLIIEYGLTSRLTLGVVVPLVETRTTLIPALNPNISSRFNVGPNPAALGNANALSDNAGVVNALRAATLSLQSQLTQCQTTPSGAGCGPLLAQQATALALIQSSGNVTGVIERLYGTDRIAHPGEAYVPAANDPIQKLIDLQIASLAAQLQNLLGTNVLVGRVAGANGAAGLEQLQALFAANGRDTLQSTDRASIGDISLGATLQLLNTFGDTAGVTAAHPQMRLSVNGTFRIGTGQPANRNRAFDIGTGYGQNGIIGSAAADLRFGARVSGSAIASYTAQLGSIVIPRVPGTGDAIYPLSLPFSGTYSAGNVLQLSVIPRIRLAGYLALTGQYSLVHTGADQYTIVSALTPGEVSPNGVPVVAPIAPFGFTSSTAQQVGFGFAYSTIVGPSRGPGAIPFEVSYSHLETLAGNGGPVYKTFRDRIELKVYVGGTGTRR